MDKKYTGLTQEHFDLITARYEEFQRTCGDVTKEPVKVFGDLSAKSLAELELIREVSKDLQLKKEEDMLKVAQAAQERTEPQETLQEDPQEKNAD